MSAIMCLENSAAVIPGSDLLLCHWDVSGEPDLLLCLLRCVCGERDMLLCPLGRVCP